MHRTYTHTLSLLYLSPHNISVFFFSLYDLSFRVLRGPQMFIEAAARRGIIEVGIEGDGGCALVLPEPPLASVA